MNEVSREKFSRLGPYRPLGPDEAIQDWDERRLKCDDWRRVWVRVNGTHMVGTLVSAWPDYDFQRPLNL